MTKYRNAEHAFVAEMEQALLYGFEVEVRGHRTMERTGRSFTLEKPTERYITVHGRRNSPAATVAETMWVLAGRNDVDFLTPYLPRAGEFSDDGCTWRGGYGPRLRNWNGVDQLAEIRTLLLKEPASRRAAISLFDPEVDFSETEDVPCNNWLHFLRRDGVLDMSIAVRSSDIVWGFSGINAFEWGVLHELMASWTGSKVGSQHWLVASLHIYERHYKRATAILENWTGITGYEQGRGAVAYEGTWEELPGHLSHWFQVEAAVRKDPIGSHAAVAEYPEPLFRSFLHLIRSHWLLEEFGGRLPTTEVDQQLAGTDTAFVIDELASRHGATTWEPARFTDQASLDVLRRRFGEIHRVKSAAYGDSWKRRGELIGILGNIARKIDRIENSASWSSADPESLLHTAVDLYIYLLKYQTFLADCSADLAVDLFGDAISGPKSDGYRAFEWLLARSEAANARPEEAVAQVIASFADLYMGVETGRLDVRARSAIVQKMTDLTLALIVELLVQAPHSSRWLLAES